MAKETYGYSAPQYFYWSILDGGGKYISNGATNYVKKYYDYYWDYPKKKVYYDDEGWDWEYIYVNGNHPTVSGSGAKLTGTGKADSIRNGGDKANINAGAGNDDISNGGDKANINAGAGNDDISNDGDKVTINAGTGKNTIGNSGSNVSINATADSKADYIYNDGKKVKIFAGGGSDMIENYGSLVTIFSGAGSDYIRNGNYYASDGGGDKVTIETGTGKDTIDNIGSNVSINATADAKADSISNRGDKVTILAGAGDDTITNREGDNVKIYAGDGDNLINIVGSKNVTLQTGNNLNSVVIYDSSSVSIQSGAGKNFITLRGGDNSVSISGGENEIHFAGSDDIVYTDDEKVSITVFFDGGDYNTLNTGAGDDTVWIKESSHHRWWNAPFVVDTGYQNDSIRNEAYSVSIETGYGKDTVENWGGQVTIQSGDPDITAGKNLIKNHVDDVTIQGGGQADTIENYTGRNVSINGGRGNDVIKLYSTESMENLLAAALNPLLNVVKDFNLEKINSIIDIYNTLAEAIDGFEKVSQLESSYKGKNQIKIRDRLQKISDKAGELDEALEKSEEFLESAGCGTDKISVLRKSTDKIQQVAGKGIKFSDNTEIVMGMMKEYADNKIWSTVGKELASDFEKIDGRLSFVAKKPDGIPTTVHGGKGNDKIYSDERKFHVYEYAAGDGKDTIFSWNSNDTLSITGGAYTGEIVGGDYVVTVGKGSVTFKNYTSRNIQQVIVGDSYERLPCQIEGQMLSGDYHTAYDQPATPEGILVDYNGLTVEKNFSGEINLAKDYAYVTRVDASNAAGNVEIIGSDSTEKITAGKGNDNVHSNRSFTVIHSGAGKDIVSSSGDNNSINSGADNDIIVNVGDSVTVDSGAGNDSIISDGKKNLFIVADGGNKIIYGFGKTDTLQIVDDSGTYSQKKKGDDLIITADDGKITLSGAASLKSVNIEVSVTSGREIYNDESNAVLLGTNKADTFSNRGAGVSISALGGNDSINNHGDNVTISGGKGNDSVYSWGVGTAYVYSAGNDTLQNFDEDDTIVLGSVKVNSSVSADGTVTLNLSNKKTLTLQNYWSDKINTVKAVEDVKAINVVRNYDSSVSIEGSSVADYIENSGSNVTISGGKGNDSVYSWGVGTAYVYSAGNDTLDGFNEDDTIVLGSVKVNSSVSADGTVTLNLSNKKTLTLQNYWSDKINTVKAVEDVKVINIVRNYDSSVSVEGSSVADYIENSGDNVTVSALGGNDTVKNWNANVSIHGGAGDDEIFNNGGDHVTINGGKGNDFVYSHGVGMAYVYSAGNDAIDGFNDTSTLQITSGTIDKATSDGENLFLTVGKGTIFLMGAAWLESWNVVNAKGNPISFNVDDGKAKNIYNDKSNIKISGSDNNDTVDNFGNKVTVTSGAGNDSLRNHGTHVLIEAGADDDTIEAYMIDKDSSSYTTLRGGAGNDHIDNHGHHALIEGGTGNDTLGNYTGDDNGIHEQYEADYSTMLGGDGDDLIDNHGDNSSIDGGNGNDYIYSYGANSSISGNAGDDHIFNNGDNVTISGGKGNDFVESWGVGTAYVYSAGNDTLQGFNEDDTIVLGSVKINSSLRADGTVTLNLSNKKTLTLQNYWSDKINTTKSVKDVKAISVVRNYDSSFSAEGSSADDYISNSGAGNDTLWGDGSGSSKLYGGEEVDTFIYRPGGDTDTICNYESGELLQILDAGFSDSSFKNSKLTLTIDAVGRDSVIFSGVSKSDSFNINGSKLR